MERIVINEELWKRARSYLLQDNEEHFAFFLAGITRSAKGLGFLIKELIAIPHSDLQPVKDGHQLKVDAFLRVRNEAKKKELALIEAHSHPWAGNSVDFSFTDREGLEQFVSYILDDLQLPYAAMVFGKSSVRVVYATPADANLKPIRVVTVIGNGVERILTIPTSHTRAKGRFRTSLYDLTVSRQVMAFGKEGQERIRETSVAIVGLGGIGSQVAQQLAYLGVRNFILADPDKVEASNLNRLVGATEHDIGRPKVETAAEYISKVCGRGAIVRAFQLDVRHSDVLDALKDVDAIFGCVDNDGSRLVLNEFALAYTIPLIDSAAGIEVQDGKISLAGGRVMLVLPDGPCLACAKEIDTSAASHDLASSSEAEFNRRRGYVSGAHIPSPSVVSLNGQIASCAVTEFMALVTGFRRPRVYTAYDMLEEDVAMTKRTVKPDPECFECTLKSVGDLSAMGRYTTPELQTMVEAR